MNPCIFCSGEAEIVVASAWNAAPPDEMPDIWETYIARCTRCGCATKEWLAKYLAYSAWQRGLVIKGTREPFTVGADVTEEMICRAAEIVSREGYGSNEIIRNGLGIGYARAAEIIKELQSAGILGTELDADARLELQRPCGFY